MLQATIQLNDYSETDAPYFTRLDNALTSWAARSLANWEYLCDYTDWAHDEWRYLGSRTDRSSRFLGDRSLARQGLVHDLEWPAESRDDPTQLTGEWTAEDYVGVYRYYYANKKRHLFGWSKDRSMLSWIPGHTVET